jgi:hypothetical protein
VPDAKNGACRLFYRNRCQVSRLFASNGPGTGACLFFQEFSKFAKTFSSELQLLGNYFPHLAFIFETIRTPSLAFAWDQISNKLGNYFWH